MAVAFTNGMMLSTKKMRSADSSEKPCCTGNAAQLELHLGDGLKPPSSLGNRNSQQSSTARSSEGVSSRSNVKLRKEHMQQKVKS